MSESLYAATVIKQLVNSFDSEERAILADLIGDTESPVISDALNQLDLECIKLKRCMIETAQKLIEIHNAEATS